MLLEKELTVSPFPTKREIENRFQGSYKEGHSQVKKKMKNIFSQHGGMFWRLFLLFSIVE